MSKHPPRVHGPARSERQHTRRPVRPTEVKRMRRRVLIVLYALFALEVGAALLSSPGLAVKRVVVTGARGLPAAEASAVIAQATRLAHKNWFRTPVGSVEQALRRMPWVRAAHVTRQLPDRTGVHISLRQPDLIAQIGSSRY